MDNLQLGGFYWIIPDIETTVEWKKKPHPGRYIGMGNWECLGIEYFCKANFVGKQIIPHE